jgi:predicted ATPase
MPSSNLFVITGGPGSGKSTLIEALRDTGFAVVEEAGRAVIRDEIAGGGEALPWADRQAFAQRMLTRDIASQERFSVSSAPVFFDRGIPDVLGYLRLSGLPVPQHMTNAAKNHRYNPIVFIAPHWPEIYTQDQERKQDAKEAARTCAAMNEIYRECGYDLRELPRADVAERIRFVLDAVAA